MVSVKGLQVFNVHKLEEVLGDEENVCELP